MPVSIINKFICDQCGESAIQEPEVNQVSNYDHTTSITSESKLPKGWFMFRRLLLCPNHELKRITTIDGKEISDET
jgi:hypothetical protein